MLSSRLSMSSMPETPAWPSGWFSLWMIGLTAGLSFVPGALLAATWLCLARSSLGPTYTIWLAGQGVVWCPVWAELVVGESVSVVARITSIAIMFAIPAGAAFILVRVVTRFVK
jgi:hypothetical protein